MNLLIIIIIIIIIIISGEGGRVEWPSSLKLEKVLPREKKNRIVARNNSQRLRGGRGCLGRPPPSDGAFAMLVRDEGTRRDHGR